MKLEFSIHGYAVSGAGASSLPAGRCVPFAPAGTKRKGARLPLLARRLAQLAMGEAAADARTNVVFGTGLGCLTESELFLANLIEHAEAMPKPRAFTASVHNAIASRVALDLGAQGQCQTFVHGELSGLQALFASALIASSRRSMESAGSTGRERHAGIVCGALDEAPCNSFGALAALAGPAESYESGGVFWSAGDADASALALVEGIALGRADDMAVWFDEHLDADSCDALLLSAPVARACPQLDADVRAARSEREGASDFALQLAQAVALVSAELAPESLGLRARPRCVALLCASGWGDVGCCTVRSE